MNELTRREYIAAMAMQGLLATGNTWSLTPETVSRMAVEHANALIKRLDKWGPDGRIRD